jgi:hypothetical protein
LFFGKALLKLIVDLAHYVDWSGNQQASLTEPLEKKKAHPASANMCF